MFTGLRFSKSDRRDLERSLRANGCKNVTPEILNAFESHVERYYRKVVAKNLETTLWSAVQAYELWEASLNTWTRLEILSSDNLRRMIRKFPAKNGELLEDYHSGVDEICSGSEYAFERAKDKMATKPDRELRRLCREVAREWKKATGRSFPPLPVDEYGEFRVYRWHEVRQLQRHPLWIVMNSLGSSLPVSITSMLEGYALMD